MDIINFIVSFLIGIAIGTLLSYALILLVEQFSLNKKRKLTKEQKIEILRNAKALYIKSVLNPEVSSRGMCHYIGTSLEPEGFRLTFSISDLIPEFTYNNVIKLSKKYGFHKPESDAHRYWWPREANSISFNRLICFDALIIELEKESLLSKILKYFKR